MSYVHMRSLCENYVNTNALTDNILQEARNTAKFDLFGDPDNNVKYCGISTKYRPYLSWTDCNLKDEDGS